MFLMHLYFLTYSQYKTSVVNVLLYFKASVIIFAPSSPILLATRSQIFFKHTYNMFLMHSYFLNALQLKFSVVNVLLIFNTSLIIFAPSSPIPLSSRSKNIFEHRYMLLMHFFICLILYNLNLVLSMYYYISMLQR